MRLPLPYDLDRANARTALVVERTYGHPWGERMMLTFPWIRFDRTGRVSLAFYDALSLAGSGNTKGAEAVWLRVMALMAIDVHDVTRQAEALITRR